MWRYELITIFVAIVALFRFGMLYFRRTLGTLRGAESGFSDFLCIATALSTIMENDYGCLCSPNG